MYNSILVHWAFKILRYPKKREGRRSTFLILLCNKIAVGLVHVGRIALFFHRKIVGRLSKFQGEKSVNVGAKSVKDFEHRPLSIPLNIGHCEYALNRLWHHCHPRLILHVWIISHIKWQSLFWYISLKECIPVALPISISFHEKKGRSISGYKQSNTIQWNLHPGIIFILIMFIPMGL